MITTLSRLTVTELGRKNMEILFSVIHRIFVWKYKYQQIYGVFIFLIRKIHRRMILISKHKVNHSRCNDLFGDCMYVCTSVCMYTPKLEPNQTSHSICSISCFLSVSFGTVSGNKVSAENILFADTLPNWSQTKHLAICSISGF